MFNQELISWSIDGGGDFFLRKEHKFNLTNVCGYLLLNSPNYDYRYVFEYLTWQFQHMQFDYVSKAHPSVIRTLYYLPNESIEGQKHIGLAFDCLFDKRTNEEEVFERLNILKKALLNQLFI